MVLSAEKVMERDVGFSFPVSVHFNSQFTQSLASMS